MPWKARPFSINLPCGGTKMESQALANRGRLVEQRRVGAHRLAGFLKRCRACRSSLACPTEGREVEASNTDSMCGSSAARSSCSRSRSGRSAPRSGRAASVMSGTDQGAGQVHPERAAILHDHRPPSREATRPDENQEQEEEDDLLKRCEEPVEKSVRACGLLRSRSIQAAAVLAIGVARCLLLALRTRALDW